MASADENHITDLLPDFVLDTLTENEMLRVYEHVQTCPSCQEELTRFQQVADDLPLAIVQAAPRPEVKLKLMQSIHAKKLKSVISIDNQTATGKFGEFFRRNLPAFTIALILILVLSNLFLWRQLILAQGRNTYLRVVTMTNTQYSPGAVGTMVVSPNGQDLTLVVDRLTILEPNKQYQVWLIKGTEHVSAAIFSVDQSGYASVVIQAPQPIQQFDAVGISVEPAGGSPQPTGTSVLHAFLIK